MNTVAVADLSKFTMDITVAILTGDKDIELRTMSKKMFEELQADKKVVYQLGGSQQSPWTSKMNFEVSGETSFKETVRKEHHKLKGDM